MSADDLTADPHVPHTMCVIFKHDSLNVLVVMAMCELGTCNLNHPRGPLVERYRAAGMEAADYPPSPWLDFWEDHEVLRTMAHLKLAQHEGRRKAAEWAKARLVELTKKGTP